MPAAQTPIETEQRRLSCLELRGGNHFADYSAELPGLEAWVHCLPLRPSANGGDVYYLSVCSHGAISRITLADIAGHGDVVSESAIRLRDAMREHADHWDQSHLIQNLNDTFLKGGGDAVEFATAFLVGYYGQTGELLFTNAGHPHPLWYRAATGEWSLMRETTPWSIAITDLPLGLIPGTTYTQTAIQLEIGDLLVLYTDGLSESENPAGEMLGQDGLLDLARRMPVAGPAETGAALLASVEAYRAGAHSGDDETIIVLRRVPAAPAPETSL